MTSWNFTSTVPPLTPRIIHIWQANLDLSPERIRHLQTILSPEESQRASRFKFLHLQQRFIAAKGILRTLLGTYLNQSPGSIKFSYGPHGKPELDPQLFSTHSLHFNQSDSKTFALYAFTKSHPVGVDIEYIRTDIEALPLAKRFFSPNETIALNNQPPEQQIPAFFRIWTRKEAFIKAVGEGLSFPLDEFEVNLDEESAKLLSIYTSTVAAARWTLLTLKPNTHYIGAAAVEAPIDQVKLFNYQ